MDPVSGSFTRGQVTSKDGTHISFRRYGTGGPGVILVHGGAQAAQNLGRLAQALSDRFTVYVPDRRGRGSSGPPGDRYGLAAERDDIAALVEHSGGADLFGLSSGGLIALSAARTVPGIRRLAVYEPPLSTNHSTPLGWVPRYERELAAGELGAAAVTAMRGTRTAGPALRLVPRPVVTAALNRVARDTSVRARPDMTPTRRAVLRVLLWPLRRAAAGRAERSSDPTEVALRDLVPTMHYDAQLVVESEGTLADYAQLTMPVLLLGGSRSAGYLTRTLDALEQVLPDVRRVELAGVGHPAPDNTGSPGRVADELRRFFTDPD